MLHHLKLNSTFICGMLVGAGLLGAGLALGGASRQQPQDASRPGEIIRTRQIEIIDEVGTSVLVIGSNTEGGSISIRDRFGKTLVLASAAHNGGALSVNRVDGASAVTLETSAHGGEVSVRNAGGRDVIDLRAGLGDARIVLKDASGNVLTDLNARERLGGSMNAYSATGEPAAAVYCDVAGGGVVDTYRGKGLPLVSLASTIGGHGQITTYAGPDRPLVNLTATAEHQGQIYTFNAAPQMNAAGAGAPVPQAADGEPNARPLIVLGSQPFGAPTLQLFNHLGELAVSLGATESGTGEIAVWRRDGTGKSMRP